MLLRRCGISLQIVTEIQIFLSPYFQKILQERLEKPYHILESHLESLL